MRRSEFEIDDKKYFDELLKTCEFGVLSLNDNGQTYSVPVNFSHKNSDIFIHGAIDGRKYKIIEKNKNASFLVIRPFSFIPSTFSKTKLACSATQFFASAMCEGEITILKEPEQKAKALNILMDKFQNKDSFLDIEEHMEKYKNMLEKTAVFCFAIKNISLKVKVGQNMNSEKIDSLIKELEQSEKYIDKLTIKHIQKFTCKE